MELVIKRSFRKSLSLKVCSWVINIKAPFFVSKKVISDFIDKHKSRIEKRIKREERYNLSDEQIVFLKKEAKKYIPKRVDLLADKFWFEFNKIRITSAKTRWGSCSSKKNLNFSFRLMKYSKEAIDYVIIHELAHLKHMNHSKKFWKEVEIMMPEYKKHEKILKE